MKTLRWEILPKALSMSKQMEEVTENARASGISTNQATRTGGQIEDARSVVRFSREGLASALRLTGQMIVVPQFGACRQQSKPRLVHSLHRQKSMRRCRLLGIPENSVALSRVEFAGSLRNPRPSARPAGTIGNPAARHRMEPMPGVPMDSVPSELGRIICWENQELGDATREGLFAGRVRKIGSS